MSLSGAKSQHFIMTAILVSALTLCWSAEAAPKKYKSASRYIKMGIVTVDDVGSVACYAQNKNVNKDICAVFEYDNSAWWFFPPAHARRVQRRFTPREIRLIDFGAWAPRNQGRSLHCKLVSASYIQHPGGKDLFTCPY